MDNMIDDNVKLLQQFLTIAAGPGPSIVEVGLTTDNKVVCNCAKFAPKQSCRHSRYIKALMDDNLGEYPYGTNSRATAEDIAKSKLSNKNFREFIVKFGSIEVI